MSKKERVEKGFLTITLPSEMIAILTYGRKTSSHLKKICMYDLIEIDVLIYID